MSKRLLRMGFILLAVVLCLSLIALPACAPAGEEEEGEYTLTISSTAGGSVTPATGTHSYPQGTVVNLTATAATGYDFVNWTGGPVADANDPTTTITMDADHSIKANFEGVEVPVISLRMATYFGATSDQAQLLRAFAADLATQSGGALNITCYDSETLGKAAALYGSAVDGSIDIIMTGLHYTSGVFKTMEALYQPLGEPSAWVANHVANDFYQTYKPGELSNTHPLFFQASAPLMLYTSTAVYTLADLTGKIIRCGSSNNPILTALGATPHNMGQADVYESIRSGLINGCFIGGDGHKVWKLADVAKFTTTPNICGCDVFVVTMSNNAWNSLTTDLQTVFTTVSATYVAKSAEKWENLNKSSCDLGRSQNVTFISLTAGERTLWQSKMEPLVTNYVNARVGEGKSASEVNGWINYIKERITYWTAQQNAAGIPWL